MAQHARTAGQASLAVGVFTALTYAVASVVSNFVTKLAGLLLPGSSDTILTAQLAVMLTTVLLAKQLGVVDWAPISARRLLAFLPLSLTYGAHAALVLRALAILNVPIYNVLKRLTPILVLSAKACIERKLPSLHITLSVVLVVAGCVVAGIGDLTFDMHSYALALVAAALQAAYILLAEYASPSSSGSSPRVISLPQFSPLRSDRVATNSNGSLTSLPYIHVSGGSMTPSPAQDKHLAFGARQTRSNPGLPLLDSTPNKQGSSHQHAAQPPLSCLPTSLQSALSVSAEGMYYASLTCLPITAGVAYMTGQVKAADTALQKMVGETGQLAAIVIVVLIANIEWMLTGSLILCTQTNSALTTTVVGVLKGIIAVILGFFLLGGVGPQGMSALGITGITMNCAGGVWYAYAKYKEGSASKKPVRK